MLGATLRLVEAKSLLEYLDLLGIVVYILASSWIGSCLGEAYTLTICVRRSVGTFIFQRTEISCLQSSPQIYGLLLSGPDCSG